MARIRIRNTTIPGSGTDGTGFGSHKWSRPSQLCHGSAVLTSHIYPGIDFDNPVIKITFQLVRYAHRWRTTSGRSTTRRTIKHTPSRTRQTMPSAYPSSCLWTPPIAVPERSGSSYSAATRRTCASRPRRSSPKRRRPSRGFFSIFRDRRPPSFSPRMPLPVTGRMWSY